MARAGLRIAALLASVSQLAIGTAHAVELSPPDADQVTQVVVGTAVVMIVGTAFQGMWRRFCRGRLGSFWTSTLGRWLIGRIAGTAVYLALVAAAWTPALYVVVYLFAGFASVAGFKAAMAVFPAFQVLVWVIALAAAWRLRTIAKEYIGKGSRPLRRLARSLGMGGGGSSGFAGICEEWACRWKPGMILLGASLFDRRWLVGIKDDRMMMTAAGTGAGKGRSAIIPNMMTYPGSVYCQDFKGQIAAVTAQIRREMGQTVHIFDPMSAVMEKGARLNPLEPLDPEARDYVEQIDSIVDAIVIGGDEKNRFFEDAARTLIAGLIDYVVRARGKEEFKAPQADAAMEGGHV